MAELPVSPEVAPTTVPLIAITRLVRAKKQTKEPVRAQVGASHRYQSALDIRADKRWYSYTVKN
ncbi:hypothetical protein L916_02675 [Phytophthora nicotianae]|uniref:Uncharacterized protein n=2 Tax=Phytophthora nicotianae TaxID=4792 RepID=W2JMF8_PHYNI|nr:hypothetical protein L916_02675 [Phytophthora nicotianae]